MNKTTEWKYAEWQAEGERLFGKDKKNWKFVCPSCGHVQSVADYMAAGASEGMVAFSCIGRMLEKPKEAFNKDGGPCNYAGGGLIGLNPWSVENMDGKPCQIFAFAYDKEVVSA